MDWTEIKATATESGRSFVVARAAFVMGFYGDSAANAYGEPLLDLWLKLVPAGTPLYYLGKRSHQFREVTPRVLSRIRTTLRNLADEGQFYMLKDAPEFTAGRYSLELGMGVKPGATGTNHVHVALPVEFPESVGTDTAVATFRAFPDAIPFKHATAGYGFDLVWGREWEMVALPVIIRAARRYLALDVRHRLTESGLADQLKGPGWLTFLGNDLLEKLGGRDAVTEALGNKDVPVIPCQSGVIVKAGDRPPIGDVNRFAPDLEPMRRLDDLIKPVRIQRWDATNLFRADDFDANEWFSRLEP